MQTIFVNNVNDALVKGVRYLSSMGLLEKSRNGLVKVSPLPVCTVYEHPLERVLLDPVRDANPFFHVMEFLWMMAGRDDSEWISAFNSRMKEFAEDDGTIWGAYGDRWRLLGTHEDGQIETVIDMLKTDPTTRRAVIAMWSPDLDLGIDKKDLPCNTHIYVTTAHGRLDMTVCCRSNDIIWGAYGANAVHFSYLQEYIANSLDVQVGRLYQFSNNYHMYVEREDVVKLIPHFMDVKYGTPAYPGAPHYRLFGFDKKKEWDDDLYEMFHEDNPSYVSEWFLNVLEPMHLAWGLHKDGHTEAAIQHAKLIKDNALMVACVNWLERRLK